MRINSSDWLLWGYLKSNACHDCLPQLGMLKGVIWQKYLIINLRICTQNIVFRLQVFFGQRWPIRRTFAVNNIVLADKCFVTLFNFLTKKWRLSTNVDVIMEFYQLQIGTWLLIERDTCYLGKKVFTTWALRIEFGHWLKNCLFYMGGQYHFFY